MSPHDGPAQVGRPVVALDGPGSSGKSSVGAAVAAGLGLRFCDTGLFYRAVAFEAGRRGISPSEPERLAGLVDEIRVVADGAGRYDTVTVGGIDVTASVHSQAVDETVSAYAGVPALRDALLVRQRALAAEGGIIMAGRDIGTVVLPDADLKVYLNASVEERARRRAGERGDAAGGPNVEATLTQLRERDELDASRPVAPLRQAPGAVVIETDGNSFEQTVALVRASVERLEGADHAKPEPEAEAPRRARHPSVGPTPIATRVTAIIAIASFVMRLIANFFTHVSIEGDMASIPRHGPVLIVANHVSNADPVLIGGFLNARIGRPLNWMGKREVFEMPFISWLARHGGIHPVERGAADIEAFKTALRILDGGHILAVFPEGTRSPDGRLQRAKDGVAVLAMRSNAVVVPIGLADSNHLWPRGHKFPVHTPRVTVRIGEPFNLAEALAAAAGATRDPESQPRGGSASASRRQANTAGTDLIMRRIADLLPERQRGAYGPADPS
ncbi:MAG: (d)CMP kinase [Chloroflexota bacterium]